MKSNKKGISLIVLVITIVVVIIIAVAVILALGRNNPIEAAREASFKQRVDSYKAELTNYMSKKFADSLGVISSDDIDATSTEDMKKIIPSLAKDDESKFIIENGKLIYIAKDDNEIEWCTQLMVDTTALVAKISANVTSPTEASSITYTFKFNTDVTGFEEGDIEVTNGTIVPNTFTTVSNSEYTVVVTNTGACTQTITIPKNVCKDASNNDNKLSSYSIVISERVTATIINMTDGDLSISATVTVDGNANYSNSKYVFTTSSDPLGTDATKYKDGNITLSNTTITKSKVSGTYYLHVLLASTSGTLTEIISDTTATCQGKKDFAYSGEYKELTVPSDGKYLIELWGASGGDYDTSLLGGRGAYTSGKINLIKDEKLYFYVGQQPSSNQSNYTGGWNGGGGAPSNKDKDGRTGGGATDVRTVKTSSLTAWNEPESLRSRIMVAGAGGGAAYESSASWRSDGGAAGGINGYIPANMGSSASNQYGKGGTQLAGGAAYRSETTATAIAGFGYGGNGISTDGGTGGGSGYYGGGGSNVCSGGGGGSSYISGFKGCIAVISSSSNSPRLDSSNNTCNDTTAANDVTCSYHYDTTKRFEEAVMKDGKSSMTSPTGTNETGHTGNGYARITVIE